MRVANWKLRTLYEVVSVINPYIFLLEYVII